MPATFIWQQATRLVVATQQALTLRDMVVAGGSVAAGQDAVTAHDAPYLLCATSGSSGLPKVIRRDVASWQTSFAVNGQALHLGPGTCAAVFSGFGASLALYGVLEAAHHGAAVLCLAHTRPDRWAQALADHGATTLYVTPTQLALICDTSVPLPQVRHILVGGGRLSGATQTAALTTCPNADLIQFYGAAETSFITWTNADTPPGSVGKAYPGVALRVDAEGLIWVKSPYLFRDYASGTSPDTRWHDGALTVGEVGHMDAAGHLFVTGRRNRMVTVADNNVFPEAAEACLADLLPGARVAVVALPDPQRGARLVACVAGVAPGTCVDDLLRHCRQALGPHAAPHRIHLVDDLPILPTGKPDYRAITAHLRPTA